MTERDKIVAWLRRSSMNLEIVPEDYDAMTWREIALRIEHGEHLIRPEPTVSVAEWLPKSNLTY